ncbi:Protein of unknown function (DUF2721) [Halobacteroides halobius DSM 5150]|uniref:DUF2721 domain-containing protein n=1 Tax=Halobacteroides halobius (strain ATCC 35273 / DSM 5150 / MD-1) TaxID=748449 RepID=L0K8I1_HALHC|nr:DUF2721 domain-containing protein [Halobacteroides halobius]AGB41301.1 Protein of unknown function (DUF2721) [Halobacteroides halobius DSM 5150]
MQITTPAVLFSTVSLLMSAYAARFSAIAKLMRGLSLQIKSDNLSQKDYYKKQISILSKRIYYIKHLHFFGVLSLFCSTLAMLLLLFKEFWLANIIFIVAIVFFLIALAIAIIEVYHSTTALDIKSKI